MDVSNVQDILKQIEEQLASVENLDPVAEQAIEALLNLIERLVAAQQELLQQVKRLKEQLENKKKAKTTAADNDANKKSNQDHSSEKHRKNRQPPPALRADRRSFKGVPISLELARSTMLSRPTKRRPSVSIDNIQKATASFFEVPLDLLLGSTRKQEVTAARHVGMYLCKSLTGAPLKAIGRHFGNRDHSTVIHACRSVKEKLAKDPGFENLVTQLLDQIGGSLAG